MSSGKTIAILQLSYIPWKGYFDLMAAVNEFLIFDEVQYTKRDWRNRNRIVSNGTVSWLKIPVATAGHWKAPIYLIEIADPQWAARHWARVDMSYRHANYSGYPEYDQGTKVFDHHTSLLDTLFNCGPATRKHLKSLRDRSAFLDPG